MALPVLNTPTYTLEIPSTKQQTKYRPFLVKEEKIILIAMQETTTENPSATVDAIKQIITNCTFGQVNPDKLTSYDLEYIFLQLKKKSSGSKIDLSFTCQNKIGDNICGTDNMVNFSLEDVKLVGGDNRESKIMITDTIGIKLKDPTFSELEKFQSSDRSIETLYGLLYTLIDTIFNGEEICTPDTQDELKEFVDNLPTDKFEKVREYFENIPKLKADIHIKCKKCGNDATVSLEGLQSFLA